MNTSSRTTARVSKNTRCDGPWIFRSIAGGGQSREHPGARLRKAAILLAVGWIASATAMGQGDDRLVCVRYSDEGFRTVDLLLRSDGSYQLGTQTNAILGGPFNFTIPASTNVQAYYRLRRKSEPYSVSR